MDFSFGRMGAGCLVVVVVMGSGRGGGQLGKRDDRFDRRVEQGVLFVVVGEGVLLEEVGQGDDHVACGCGGGRHYVMCVLEECALPRRRKGGRWSDSEIALVVYLL